LHPLVRGAATLLEALLEDEESSVGQLLPETCSCKALCKSLTVMLLPRVAEITNCHTGSCSPEAALTNEQADSGERGESGDVGERSEVGVETTSSE